MNIKEWDARNQRLRNRLIKKTNGQIKYLLANFSGTKQQKDIERRTPLVEDFFRIKINVKEWDKEDVFEGMRKDFDMPYWAFVSLANRPLKDFNNIFIYQLKGCNLHCPWCYVDDVNKNSQKGDGRFFSTAEILDVFEEERKKQPLHMFRPSGGEPTLVVEQWLENLEELVKRDLEKEVYIQGDTNLTTGHFIEYLGKSGQIKENLLKKVGEYDNFGLLCSFKGTDVESFLKASGLIKNKKADLEYAFLEEERWHTFSRYIETGIDVYPFIYAPNPDSLEEFMEKGARKFGGGFYLKTWIFPLKLYGPEKERLNKLGINSEEYQLELDKNFSRSCEIMDNLIYNKLGVNYQAIPRTGIKLSST